MDKNLESLLYIQSALNIAQFFLTILIDYKSK